MSNEVDVVEIPPCPTFRLAVERARLHLRVARLHEAGISRRRAHQIEMAERWLDQAIEELRDEDATCGSFSLMRERQA